MNADGKESKSPWLVGRDMAGRNAICDVFGSASAKFGQMPADSCSPAVLDFTCDPESSKRRFKTLFGG